MTGITGMVRELKMFPLTITGEPEESISSVATLHGYSQQYGMSLRGGGGAAREIQRRGEERITRNWREIRGEEGGRNTLVAAPDCTAAAWPGLTV